VQHRGQQRIGHAVARHVDDGNSGGALAPPEVSHDVSAAIGGGLGNPRLQIEALLEVDVDDVIAADHAVKRQRLPVHIDPVQAWQLARLRQQVARNVLKVGELVGELPEHIGVVHATPLVPPADGQGSIVMACN
jgi:hypothetical protein